MKRQIIKHAATVVGAFISLLTLNTQAESETCTGGANCWQTIKPALLDSRWASARCNDGTPASYEFRPSPTGSKNWIILFEGGGGCDDLTQSCAKRSVSLTTTSPLAHNSWHIGDHHGILNPNPTNNPDFYNANLVHVDYCSSDQWGGATTELKPNSATPHCLPGEAQCGWYFSGRFISRMAVQSLIVKKGLRDDGTHKVMFVGSSAGGFGLASAAESLSLLLPQTHAANNLRFVFDGSYILNGWDKPVPTLNNGPLMTVDAIAAKNREFWGARYETYCERDRKLQGLDPSLCMFGPIYYPYLVSTRAGLGLKVFIQNSSQDKVALARLGLTTLTDRQRWHYAMLDSFANTDWLFSSCGLYHTLIASDTGFVAGPANKKLRQVIGSFWRNEPAQKVIYSNSECFK